MSRRPWLTSVLVALTAWVSGCQKPNEFVKPPPPNVTVALPVQREVPEMMEFTGQTRATATVEIRARVDGYLKQIHFVDGSDVVKGHVLFTIDPAPFQVALKAAQAQEQKARASLQLAEANLARTRDLKGQNATTEQQVDVQEAEYATAAADIATAQAAVEQAELNLSYTEVKAPISGRVGRHLVDLGGLVQAESTPLAEIECFSPIHVYFYLSESQLLKFMRMTRMNEIPDPRYVPPELRLAVGNDPDFAWTGHLEYRELGIDPGTGTALRRAEFKNPDLLLVPGMFVRLQVDVGDPQPHLLVEERAIGSDQRGEYVLVVNAKNEVEYRPVTLGSLEKGLRVVLSGISSGEKVVVNGLQKARPGTEVVPGFEKPATPVVQAGGSPGVAAAVAPRGPLTQTAAGPPVTPAAARLDVPSPAAPHPSDDVPPEFPAAPAASDAPAEP